MIKSSTQFKHQTQRFAATASTACSKVATLDSEEGGRPASSPTSRMFVLRLLQGSRAPWW